MSLRQKLSSSTLRNAGWLVGGRLVNKILAFVVGVLSARYLGPSNQGLIDYVMAYVTFFASLCNLGINSVIVKEFVDHPEDEGTALGTSMVMQAISSLLSGVMILGLVYLMDGGDMLTVAVAALSSVGMVFHVFDTMKRWFYHRMESKYTAIATVVAYLTVSIYKIVLLITGRGVLWFAVATSVEYLVVAIFLLAAYKKKGGPKFAFSWAKGRQLLSASNGYIISGLMVSIYAVTDKLMLEGMLDKASVAYYGRAVAVSTMWTFLLEALIDALSPGIIQASAKDRALFEKKNRQLYAIIIYSALFASVVICPLAKPIVRILYGEEFLPAVAPLRIVTWYTAFSYLGGARSAWAVSENKQKYLKYLYFGAAVLNVALNAVMIPLWGVSGAAVASLITQVSTVTFLPLMIPAMRPNVKLMAQAFLLRKIK